MKNYKVRKGLESPVIIKGMQVRHYWTLVILSVVCALYLTLALYIMLTGGMHWFAWLIQMVITGVALFILREYFRSKGRIKRYKFSKVESTLSNRDLIGYLQGNNPIL